MDNRKLAAALREYNVWKKGEVNAMPFKSGQLSMLLDQAAAALEASAEAESVIEELVGLAQDAEKHMRGLSRSAYREFYDADKLYAREVADAIKSALTRAREYQGKKKNEI